MIAVAGARGTRMLCSQALADNQNGVITVIMDAEGPGRPVSVQSRHFATRRLTRHAVSAMFLLVTSLAIQLVGAVECTASGGDCSKTRCCKDESHTGEQCFEKNGYYAACKTTCTPGVNPADADKKPWSCKKLTLPFDTGLQMRKASSALCAETGGDCSVSRCCKDSSTNCYQKNAYFATCKASCTPGIHPSDADGKPWSCKQLNRPANMQPPIIVKDDKIADVCPKKGGDCSKSRCCEGATLSCFEKNSYFATCNETCAPGVHPEDGDGKAWTCKLLTKFSHAPLTPSQAVALSVVPAVTASEECAVEGGDCTVSRCCAGSSLHCYEKSQYYASCRFSCDAGLNPKDKDGGVPWTCRMLFNPRKMADDWAKAEGTAYKLLSSWPVENKLSLLVGQNSKFPKDAFNYKGYLNPQNPQHPAALDGRSTNYAHPLRINEGSQGFIPSAGHEGTATQFPALLTLAATFNPEAARRYAEALAKEFSAKGANVILGPDLEVSRTPLAGRSFQTLSGEDPYLGSRLVQPFVSELSKHGIIAVVRHWLDNNQETYEKSMNSEVGSRAQHEIYAQPFKAAFIAGAGATQCAYNRVSGVHACENQELLQQLLRNELGFRGFVMSEWSAISDAERSARSGVDLEMPGGPDGKFMYLPTLAKAGKVPSLDQQAAHVLAAMFMAGHFDDRFQPPHELAHASPDENAQHRAVDLIQKASATSSRSRSVARETIIDGAVLLKNDDSALPLAIADKTKVALVGESCQEIAVPANDGSGPAGILSLSPADKNMQPFEGSSIDLRWSKDSSAALGAEIAIVCAAVPPAQAWDRTKLTLPKVSALVNNIRMQPGRKKIIVVATVPGAITTEWMEHVDAALMLFLPGEEAAPAVAELLFGAASPAGRLPISFPTLHEKRFDADQYPGTCPPPHTWCKNLTAEFSEGMLVGYRWNDAREIPSAFPFGHGLTYTKFEFHSFWLDCEQGEKLAVHLKVKNLGSVPGVAVPQLYVSFDSLKPVVRQLRGFLKVLVSENSEADATFVLDSDDWSFYDAASGRWKNAVSEGDVVTVSLGSSSTDLNWSSPLTCDFLAATDNSGLARPLYFGP